MLILSIQGCGTEKIKEIKSRCLHLLPLFLKKIDKNKENINPYFLTLTLSLRYVAG